jgi:hypothetical protein
MPKKTAKLPVSRNQLQEYKVPGTDITFYWRFPSIMTQPKLQRLIIMERMVFHSDEEIIKTLREEIERLVDDKKTKDSYLVTLDDYANHPIEYANLLTAFATESAAIALMIADRQEFLMKSPVCHIRAFVESVQHGKKKVNLERERGSITEEALCEYDPEDLMMLGSEIVTTIHLSRQDRKNS